MAGDDFDEPTGLRRRRLRTPPHGVPSHGTEPPPLFDDRGDLVLDQLSYVVSQLWSLRGLRNQVLALDSRLAAVEEEPDRNREAITQLRARVEILGGRGFGEKELNGKIGSLSDRVRRFERLAFLVATGIATLVLTAIKYLIGALT